MEAYSSKGRTDSLYALISRVGLCAMKHLNKSGDLCFGLLTMSCMSFLNFKFGSIRMSRSMVEALNIYTVFQLN